MFGLLSVGFGVKCAGHDLSLVTAVVNQIDSACPQRSTAEEQAVAVCLHGLVPDRLRLPVIAAPQTLAPAPHKHVLRLLHLLFGGMCTDGS